MKRKSIRLAVLGLFLLAFSNGSAQAEWSFYNPLAAKPAKKMAKQEPSTLAKMTDGTQQFFRKSADFLNPFHDADDKPLKKPQPSFWNSMFTPAEPEPLPADSIEGFFDLPRP